jgi:hypothetical protein
MIALPFHKIQTYREKTYCLLPGKRIASVDEALHWVNERGFVYFWPIKEVVLPSLWVAVAGDRPVADAHDDPGHVTWGWKDSSLGSRRWYYAKILRKKATFISLEIVPFFYALSNNFGAPEEDYLTLYEQGRLTQEAKAIYEVLLAESPLDTIALRQATRLTSRESDSRFNRGLTELQADFKILPVAVTQAGGWRYAFAYDLVSRHYPDLPDKAHPIKQSQARQKLAELYFLSVGAAQLKDLVRLFRWDTRQAKRAVTGLAQSGILCADVEVPETPGEWFALRQIVEASTGG